LGLLGWIPATNWGSLAPPGQAAAAEPSEPAPRVADKRRAKGETADGVTVHSNLTFCSLPGADLKLDLAVPAGDGPFPAIVCVHGGGWHSGSKGSHAERIKECAMNGYVAATISYRLAPRNHFPAPLHDVKCAVRWLRAHADTYHIDKDHIGAFGDSAGGHLVCLLGVTGKKDALEGDTGYKDQSSAVQAVVAYYPPTDLTMLHDVIDGLKLNNALVSKAKKIVEDLMGGSPSKVGREAYLAASPVHHVSKEAAPTLLIHGTADLVVPCIQSQLLERKLKEAGAEAKLVLVDKAGHGFSGRSAEMARQATAEFFDRYLKRR
jgi:acetyl esterase/lipase